MGIACSFRIIEEAIECLVIRYHSSRLSAHLAQQLGGDGYFADIVKQRSAVQGEHIRLAETEALAKCNSIPRDPARMQPCPAC